MPEIGEEFKPLDLSNHRVIRTPSELHGLILDFKQDMAAARHQIRSTVRTAIYWRNILKGRGIIYAEDVGLEVGKDKTFTNERTQTIEQRVKDIREIIREELDALRLGVVMVKQREGVVFKKEDDLRGWSAVEGKENMGIKIKANEQGSNCTESANFSHPNLAREYINVSFPFIISQAEFLQETETVYGLITGQKSVAGRYLAIADAMDACSYLHSQGSAHTDVKPNNILVIRSGNQKIQGRLFDLEGVTKFGKGVYLTTRPYSPFYYYKAGLEASEGHDVFSFGISLLEAGCNTTNDLHILHMKFASLYKMYREAEKGLQAEIDGQRGLNGDLKSVFKALLSVNESKRPKLTAVASQIRSVYG